MATVIPLADMTHRCIQAALNEIPVQPSVRAAALRALAVLTAPTDPDAEPMPYTPWSHLTPTGFPLEVAFGNPSDELRLATEVGGPDLTPRKRLRLAAERLHALGHILEPLDMALCEDLQYDRPLTWGAWASLRVSPYALCSKLYAEVPDGCTAQVLRRLDAPGHIGAALSDRGGRIVMLGLPDDNLPEYYFGVNGMALSELPALYDRLDQRGAGETVVSGFETCVGRFLNRAAPNRQIGISLRPMHGDGWVMTTFIQAADLFPNDTQARQALLRAAADLGCDLSAYAGFCRADGASATVNRHCMIALTPLPGGRIDLRVGISPATPRQNMTAPHPMADRGAQRLAIVSDRSDTPRDRPAVPALPRQPG